MKFEEANSRVPYQQNLTFIVVFFILFSNVSTRKIGTWFSRPRNARIRKWKANYLAPGPYLPEPLKVMKISNIYANIKRGKSSKFKKLIKVSRVSQKLGKFKK